MKISKAALDATKPIMLSPARSLRTYLGGKLIEELHGAAEPKDSHYPEEWMISVVSSRTAGREDDGLNKVFDQSISLKELVDANPAEFLGAAHVKKFGNQTGVLVKLIDSAERLIIQTHPDKEKALELFGSAYGKTECWHFVGGREINGEAPHVYVGLKPGVTREQWKALFDEQDVQGMLNSMHKYDVQPGDTFLIEAGTPHAIGSGCLLVEIQEPTDFTIRMEKTSPSGMHIEDYLIHQGIGFEKMFDIFKYESLDREATLAKWRVPCSRLKEEDGSKEAEIIGYNQTPFFRMTQVQVETEANVQCEGVFSGLYILSGSACLVTDGESKTVKKGDQLFVPAGVSSFTIQNKGEEPVVALRLFGPQV